MKAAEARGGTNQPNVDPATFAMPPGMRMRYDAPAAALRDWVTGYAIYIGDGREPTANWYLPAPAMLTVMLDAGPLSATIRHRTYPVVEQASVWGPTSHAIRTTTHGGISVGVGLTALGWSRLVARSASRYLNAIVPLAEIVGPSSTAVLVAALEALDDDAGIAPVLDAQLPALFRHDGPDDRLTRALSRLILTDGVIAIADAAARLDTDARTLREVASRDFGMPSKALLVRARFVRSFVGWLRMGEPSPYDGIDSSYYDTSHFLADAQKFLGTTPRRFARYETGYLRASLRARAAVLGAAAHALHQGTPPPATIGPAGAAPCPGGVGEAVACR